MIVEWFVGLFVGVGEWILGLFPIAPPDMADVVAQFDDRVNQVMGQAAGLGPWLDWVYALLVVGVVVSIWLVGILIRLIRWLLSLVPTMSGGT